LYVFSIQLLILINCCWSQHSSELILILTDRKAVKGIFTDLMFEIYYIPTRSPKWKCVQNDTNKLQNEKELTNKFTNVNDILLNLYE
jgi:hypothetical protein